MPLLWSDDDPVFDPVESTHDAQKWEATHCSICGYGLMGDAIETERGLVHEACVEFENNQKYDPGDRRAL